MSENVIIAICTATGSLVAWTMKVLLRIEKRLTRVETKVSVKDSDNTTVFTKRK